MLDAKPVASTWGSEDFDDKAQSAWGFSTSDIYIDVNNEVSTINNKGYQRYCIKTMTDKFIQNDCFSYVTQNFIALNNTYLSITRWRKEEGGCWQDVTTVYFSCSSFGADVWYK